LTLGDAYKYPLRDEFLQEAAEAAMGLERQPDWMREFVKQLSSDIKRRFVSAPERIRDGAVDLFGKISGVLEPEFKGVLTPAMALSMSDEKKDNYYVPVESLKNTTFLDPDPDSIFSNSSVSDAVNRSFGKKWQCIWLFIDKDSNVINGVQGPSSMKVKGVKIDNIPANAESVWFFIGPLQTVDKIKTEYNKNKTMKITEPEESEKLYWIIYGPEK